MPKSLSDIFQSASITPLRTVTLTASATTGLNPALDLQQVNAQTSAAAMDAAVNGGNFEEKFKEGAKNAVIDTAAASVANTIGDNKQNLGEVGHKVAHATLGCALGEAKGGNCGSGALGAVVGEITAEHTAPDNTVGMSQTDIANMKTNTINLSKLTAGTAELLSGGNAADINTASATAGNAVTNNYLNHQDNEARLKAASDCANGNAQACALRDALDAKDKKTDAALKSACESNPNSAECTNATKDMRNQLATYFPAVDKNGNQLGNNTLSPAEKNAGLDKYTAKSELQSYVDLLAVSNQNLANEKPVTSQLPDKYNSDPYGVMDPNNPDLYMVVKVGNQWGVVGRSDKVSTSVGAVNGILNNTNYAPGLMGLQVNQAKGLKSNDLYTLYYNPTSNNIIKDGWETFRDKLGFTTPVTQQFSQVLSDVQQAGKNVNWVVHSQGGVIFSEAVRYNGGNLSNNSVEFHAGANNIRETNIYLKQANINTGQKTVYKNSPLDFVPNVVGLNGGPSEMLKSTLLLPAVVWGGPLASPHTLPRETVPATGGAQ